MKVFGHALFIFLIIFLLSACAMGNEWKQATSADEAYQRCLERHGNDPSACADYREGALKAQQRYEERAKDRLYSQGGYPDPCQGPLP